MKGKAFTEALFNAAINGQMTQFCEIMKPQPDFSNKKGKWSYDLGKYELTKINPRFKVGETVYLKEPYYFSSDSDLFYKYSVSELLRCNYEQKKMWKNKISMPSKYASHFIEITGVRAERMQDISEDGCNKEGIYKNSDGVYELSDAMPMGKTTIDAYANTIDKIYGGGIWENNPYVFRYEFKLLK